MLIKQVISGAHGAGFNEVYLSADDQVDLYTSQGFTIIETDVGSNRLTIMRHILMKGKHS